MKDFSLTSPSRHKICPTVPSWHPFGVTLNIEVSSIAMKLPPGFAAVPQGLVLPPVSKPEKEPLEERRGTPEGSRWPPSSHLGERFKWGNLSVKEVPCAAGSSGATQAWELRL